MNRKSILRNRRRDILRMAEPGSYREFVLNLDENDRVLQDKRQWGYCVEANINGFPIGAPARNRWEAIYAMWDAAKWCMKQKPVDTAAFEKWCESKRLTEEQSDEPAKE